MRYLLTIAVCLVILCGCGGNEAVPAPTRVRGTSTPVTWLTLDGKEADGTLAVTQINVWKDYDNRGAGIAGVGQHGQQVKLIRRSGDAVKIELPGGAQGWVTYYFIKEFK